MGRRLKARIPCHPDQLIPEIIDRATLEKREREYRKKMALNYNKRHRVVTSDDFDVGDHVYIPNCKTKGTVERIHENPRSIVVKTNNGLMRRNQRKLKKYKSLEPKYLEIRKPVEETDLLRYVTPKEQLQNHSNNASLSEKLRRSSRLRKPTRRFVEQC